ncbi:MAG: hypothetical protein K0R66_1316 [Gammaproteobacteria bacterium]|jgi:antibiotic biosynthesis monooxygenase (ABM) superfamily enzyme|nr:hypothetical protein [Gammaproteobacteria bacterium]
MYYVHVRHHLNHEGLKHFNTWYQKVHSFISRQPGYISMNSYFDQYDTGCVHIDLEFENKEKAMAWANTQIHQDLVDELNPYRIKESDALHNDPEHRETTLYIVPIDGSDLIITKLEYKE